MKDPQAEKKTEINFRKIFRKLPELYLILDPDEYEIVDASDAYLQSTRNERDDIVGHKLFEDETSLKGPQAESMKQLRASLEKVQTEKCPDTMAILYHPIQEPGKDDSFETRWWSPVNSPIINSEGQIEYIIHHIEDVTPIIHQMQGEDNSVLPELEAKEAHLTADILLRGRDLQKEKDKAIEGLRKNEQKYRNLFEAIDEGFCILKRIEKQGEHANFRFIEANPGFEIQSGFKDPVGKTILDLVPEIEDSILKVMDHVAQTGKSLRYEDYISSLDMWVSAFIFRFDILGSDHLGVLFRNITERKQTEEELRESQSRLSTAMEIDTVGIIFWGSDFKITEANEAFLRMSGLSYEEAIGKGWQELTPKEFYATSKKAMADIEATGHTEPYEKQYYRMDGSRWWGLSAPRRISDQQTVEYILDITERKYQEQRDKFLLKLNDTLRSVSDSERIPNQAIQLLQEQLNTNRVLFIESEGDHYVVKNDITDGVPSIEGKIDLSDFGSSLIDTLRAGKTYVERDAQRDPDLESDEKKSFQQINVRSKVAVPLVKDGKLTVILAAERKDPHDWSDHEITLVKETAERTWAYIERLRAEEKLVALKNNLEERVKERTAALQSYQDQLRSLASRLNKAEQKEQNRLATELHDNLGQLLTLCKIKVHDIKNNIRQDDIANEINDLFELIDDALTYTRELTSDLKPPPSLSKEDFSEILDWIIRKMEKHGLQVTVEDDNKPKPLDEETRTPLHQSVKELLFNVVKHSGVNEAFVTVSRDNGMIKVTVEDHGKGFTFEGEKPVPTEEGGFGLFNIRERMNFIGGQFEIYSEPDSGTKATLYAPLKEKKTIRKTEGKDKQKTPLAEETTAPAELQQQIKVLIADDHDMVRRGLRNLIEEQDDMIITAEADNGKEAVELAHKTHPDVVVMDVNMPIMDGIEATRDITSSLPNTHVIGLSFYDHDEVARNMRSAGASAYLSKDEAFEALCATIRSEASVLKG